MDGVFLILEKSPPLTDHEKLEILNLGWLFTHVSESCRERAMGRILPLLGETGIDARTYMSAVREIGEYLQSALEQQIERK
jgi:hypothetical protein